MSGFNGDGLFEDLEKIQKRDGVSRKSKQYEKNSCLKRRRRRFRGDLDVDFCPEVKRRQRWNNS
jgi:hypothetical protein